MQLNSTTLFKKTTLFFVLFCLTTSVFAQLNPFWSTGGNATANGAFLGTTNGEPLVFKTNNLEAMRIKANGEVKITSLSNLGKGLVTTNNNGVLGMTAFPNDTNQVFCGSGNFKSIATLSGWTRTGNMLYNSTGVYVGIGTSSPQYLLDVNGDAYFNGTIYATGVILANKMLVDTMKAGNMFSLNNNLHMSAGTINEMYTSTGDLRIQSNAGNNNNTIFHAGTTGNVGIGTFSPQFKLDVVGPVRFSGDVYVARIRPLPGDSVVRIGDSTIFFWGNRMYPSTNTVFKGLAIGNASSNGLGLYSLALGSKVTVASGASYSIVMGSGVIGGSGNLINTIPGSLMIGFNSDKPTLFVGPSAGAGTTGYVGIGMVTPQYPLDVCGTIRAKEVRVNTTGCDFVFEPNYKLMSIDSLGTFVQKEKHLPGIPTAKEMEGDQGVALGELNTLYLQKIEELTLYVIELNERIKVLEAAKEK